MLMLLYNLAMLLINFCLLLVTVLIASNNNTKK